MQVLARDALTGTSWSVSLNQHLLLEQVVEASPSDTPWIISPGFFDLQVNGYKGIDLNSEDLKPEQVRDLVEVLIQEGVTTFLPTLVTGSRERFLQAIGAMVEARNRWPEVALAIPGIHLEGPYISPIDGARGAHPKEHVRPPSLSEFEIFQRAANGLVRLFTLAPETEGAMEFIRSVAATGVRVAIGHSMAEGKHIEGAVQAGATLSTHLGNGAPAQLPRHPNVIWEQLGQQALWASIIVDGHHLSPGIARSIIRAKGLDKVCLVSDSVSLGGMPPGVYSGEIGGEVEVLPEGKAVVRGTPYLAGATISLREAIERTVQLCETSLGDAVQMASVNPTRYMGLSYRSLVLSRWDDAQSRLEIKAVQVGGKLRYVNPAVGES